MKVHTLYSNSKFPSGSEKKKRNMKTDLSTETEKERSEQGTLSQKTGAVLREIRASPPTPQRFPSPSAQKLMHTKLTSAISCSTGIGSPLKNQNKSTPVSQFWVISSSFLFSVCLYVSMCVLGEGGGSATFIIGRIWLSLTIGSTSSLVTQN
jgi:hypothetical protein